MIGENITRVETPSPIIILDTSAFFINIPLSGRLYTVQAVVDELKDVRGKARLEVLLSQDLTILNPGHEAISVVKKTSEKSGDSTVLSPTDIDLLALAYELKGEIYSDDFALQNTAQHLNIAIHSMLQKKAGVRTWKLRCAGCGAYFKIMPVDSLCHICGSPVRRKNK